MPSSVSTLDVNYNLALVLAAQKRTYLPLVRQISYANAILGSRLITGAIWDCQLRAEIHTPSLRASRE